MFLDAVNAFSMLHMLRNLILMIYFVYRTILSCLEDEKRSQGDATPAATTRGAVQMSMRSSVEINHRQRNT